MTQQVQTIDHEPLPAEGSALTPMNVIDRAVMQGASVETIEKLMGLQERWEANQARKAFDAAMAAAKGEFPMIQKNRHVGFESKRGGASTDYWHEDMAAVAKAITPVLTEHGLSYRFRTSSNPGEPISVTCIISHRLGHSEENTLVAGRDETGNKNSIQQIGSTVTYLQRYTLKAALGLAVSGDDDGAKADAPETITDAQANELLALIQTVDAKVDAFCRIFSIEEVSHLPAKRFDEACRRLNEYGQNRREQVSK